MIVTTLLRNAFFDFIEGGYYAGLLPLMLKPVGREAPSRPGAHLAGLSALNILCPPAGGTSGCGLDTVRCVVVPLLL
jgi:hypothetical protein